MRGSRRILFVCTKFGSRSLLAAHLCNTLSPSGDIAAASSFDARGLSRYYFDQMGSMGYGIPREQPPNLFERFNRGETFDLIVTLCCEESGEQCRILGLSVSELYGKEARIINWPVPDILRTETGEPGMGNRISRLADELELRIGVLLEELSIRPAAMPCRRTHSPP